MIRDIGALITEPLRETASRRMVSLPNTFGWGFTPGVT
jgi:hypothetical protein